MEALRGTALGGVYQRGIGGEIGGGFEGGDGGCVLMKFYFLKESGAFEESHGVSVYNLESKAARTLISAYSRKDYSLEVENL